jgi:arylsulfatase A-like enzyme
MALQRFGVQDNTWYPIIWIAAVFNGLLVGAAGVVIAAILSRRPASSRVRFALVFTLFMLSLVPVLAVMLEEWIYPSAILLLMLGAASVCTRWYFSHEAWTMHASRSALRVSVGITLVAFVTIEGGTWLKERVASSRLPAAAASAPNVLLIIVDTLRSDHLASYGYERRTSPAIDALAAQGVLFENSFSTSSYTLPSHASILTGRYPRDHQVEWDTAYRRPAQPVPTLPQMLQSQGYRTGAFSANTLYFSREHGFGRGFLHFEDFFHSAADRAWRTGYGAIVQRLVRRPLRMNLAARKLAADVTSAAERWISRDPGRPFFVTMNFMDVHDPYLPPQPYRSKFSTMANPGGLINFRGKVPESLTPEQLQGEVDAYDGAIAYVDAEVSRLMSAIEAKGLTRQLLVIVTSDHGEEFFEHGSFGHGRHLYREVIQVPLIVWGPGRVAQGKRMSQPVSTAAIPATIMSLLGADAAPFPIPSLQPLWEGTRTDFPLALSELKQTELAGPIQYGSMRSLVDGSWHYIEQAGRGYELFAFPTDPREAFNLATSPAAPDIARRFKELIR